jgi:CheY-like chemotaxis protein
MTTGVTRGRLPEILLVEDNDNDVELTRQGFKLAKLAANLHHAPNGEECLRFLRKQGEYAQAPTPDLILLDLNMPRLDGRAVLAELVADEALRHLPVVILTTSAEEEEVLRMYELRCSSYIVKPVDFDEFLRVIRLIGEYWFTVVTLPGS